MDYESKSLKAQMRRAYKLKAKFVAILGEDELTKGIIALRDMAASEQEEVKMGNFTEEIKKRAKC